jgi:hypothetical protein
VKALHAGGLVLASVIALVVAPAALAQEATTEPTTTDQTTTTTDGTTTDPTTTDTNTTTTEPTTASTTAAPARNPWAETPRTRYLYARAMWFKVVARQYTRLMQRDPQRVSRSRSDFDSLLRYRRWLRKAWRARLHRARYQAHHPPHLTEWRCIHSYEGGWKDPNSPYYGGLQMDLSFQRAYGLGLLRRKGTADHWFPYEQMWIAERALRAGRGFYPWPLTARRCGLI